MKQVLLSGTGIMVLEVPAPQVEPGTVIVEVARSCISVGTELSGVAVAEIPLWKRAIEKPRAVAKLATAAATGGLEGARGLLDEKLGPVQPIGYSAAGRVIDVGEGVFDLAIGDIVACAGAQYAHHAATVRVPHNLCVRVPDGVDVAAASTVTLGAIALQGVRRAEPTLGEVHVVVGLGALGLLTVQMLKANGCVVLCTDLDEARLELAHELGADACLRPSEMAIPARVAALTGGAGADGVIVTAATRSDDVLSSAFRMCRKKGRVVLVGDVGMNLRREDLYVKELDFRISTSYGPGRYDRRYEEEGLDYPIGYVRWTENRNMAEYLRLVRAGHVEVARIISATYPVDDAAKAYDDLQRADPRPTLVLLAYPESPGDARVGRDLVVANPKHRPAAKAKGRLRIAVIGAGGFARGMHLPNLRALASTYDIAAIASRTGHNAASVARSFGARYATTDVDAVLGDPEIDAVLVATRHGDHASRVLAALEAGKHVLVEKPLALTDADLARIRAWFEARVGRDVPVLLTGYNRRFSKFALAADAVTSERHAPLMIDYRMNAGFLAADHWTFGPDGGGRNLGEACHIYDLFTFYAGARCTSVKVTSLAPEAGPYQGRDNFVATIGFHDGSVASLLYTALGTAEHAKERMEIFVDGKVVELDDYRRQRIAGTRIAELTAEPQDKGHHAELVAFADAVRGVREWPIPLWQQLQSAEIALAVDAQLCAHDPARAAGLGLR